ncbi:unnamed protein product [Brassica rapa subsp. trilocularis]
MEEKSWFGFCPSSSWINMSITKFWESRAFINLSLSPLNLESSFHADGSMRRSYKIRVTVLLNGYHVNPIPEVDLEGMEGKLKDYVAVWKGKRISTNLLTKKAWRKLGAMSPEEAIEKYIEIVTQLYPTWKTDAIHAFAREGEGEGEGGVDIEAEFLVKQKS